eukprot:1152043-Pelagomonas_calceolata.AAC.6
MIPKPRQRLFPPSLMKRVIHCQDIVLPHPCFSQPPLTLILHPPRSPGPLNPLTLMLPLNHSVPAPPSLPWSPDPATLHSGPALNHSVLAPPHSDPAAQSSGADAASGPAHAQAPSDHKGNTQCTG